MGKQKFTKKIFTAKLLFNDIGFIITRIHKMKDVSKNKKITKPFFEKIMTIVSAVNGCVYCQWFHVKKSLSVGINNEEIKNMLTLQFKTDASDYELNALLYAQHYAETSRKPDEELTKQLLDFYGKETSEHIIIIIRMIYFGNLTGNTFDAFLSRFKGSKAENSNIIFEFFFFILNAPVLLPLMPLVKIYRN